MYSKRIHSNFSVQKISGEVIGVLLPLFNDIMEVISSMKRDMSSLNERVTEHHNTLRTLSQTLSQQHQTLGTVNQALSLQH